MSKTIWKFTPILDDESVATVEMPVGAMVLTAREQGTELCIWAEVDPEAATETRRFHVFGTGHPMSCYLGDYVGTAMLYGGKLVLHVYEAAPPYSIPTHRGD
jgi:hypothetical protein